MIHVAPVSAYPTEAEARAVFANEATAADLRRASWTKEDA